jgi:hypothetical protein
MTPTLHRIRARTGSVGQAVTALRRLGVPESMLSRPTLRCKSRQGFWDRRVDYLAILERARALWRSRIKRVHPDQPGGCAKRAIELNALWLRVRKSFAAKGYELP